MILLKSAITARGNTQKGYARKATRHGQLQVINDLNGIEVCKACRSARHAGLQGPEACIRWTRHAVLQGMHLYVWVCAM